MAQTARRVLIIHEGSLPGIVATLDLLERGVEHACWWVPADDSPLRSLPLMQGEAGVIKAQAATLGVETIIRADGSGGSAAASGVAWPTRGMAAIAGELLAAVGRASDEGVGRVVWPIVAGDDLDGLSAVTALTTSIEAIAGLERGSSALSIETPLADLTERQFAQLAAERRAGDLLAAPHAV